MPEAIAKLQAYRNLLKKQGRLIEARAVGHCIQLIRGAESAVTKSGKPASSRA